MREVEKYKFFSTSFPSKVDEIIIIYIHELLCHNTTFSLAAFI